MNNKGKKKWERQSEKKEREKKTYMILTIPFMSLFTFPDANNSAPL